VEDGQILVFPNLMLRIVGCVLVLMVAILLLLLHVLFALDGHLLHLLSDMLDSCLILLDERFRHFLSYIGAFFARSWSSRILVSRSGVQKQ